MCLVATSVRVVAPYRSQAEPRYSPVMSKPLVKPKSVAAVRYTPPFWGVVLAPVLPPPLSFPPPHAAATRVATRASPTMLSLRLLLPIVLRLSERVSSLLVLACVLLPPSWFPPVRTAPSGPGRPEARRPPG